MPQGSGDSTHKISSIWEQQGLRNAGPTRPFHGAVVTRDLRTAEESASTRALLTPSPAWPESLFPCSFLAKASGANLPLSILRAEPRRDPRLFWGSGESGKRGRVGSRDKTVRLRRDATTMTPRKAPPRFLVGSSRGPLLIFLSHPPRFSPLSRASPYAPRAHACLAGHARGLQRWGFSKGRSCSSERQGTEPGRGGAQMRT